MDKTLNTLINPLSNTGKLLLVLTCRKPLPSPTNITQKNLSLVQHKKSLPTEHALAGFSLIELLVTILVFSILLVIATPSFRTMLMNNRLTTSTDAMVNALNFARTNALSNGVNVAVCPVGTNSSTTCGGDWSAGWKIIIQPAAGGNTILKVQESAPTAPTVTGTAASVTFDSHGLATTQSNFTFCDSRGGAFARSVTVLATGYAQSGPTPGLAVWNNGALACP